MKKPTFLKRLCIRKDTDDRSELVVGQPEHPEQLDASDGDWVAIYVLDHVARFRTNPRLSLKD